MLRLRSGRPSSCSCVCVRFVSFLRYHRSGAPYLFFVPFLSLGTLVRSLVEKSKTTKNRGEWQRAEAHTMQLAVTPSHLSHIANSLPPPRYGTVLMVFSIRLKNWHEGCKAFSPRIDAPTPHRKVPRRQRLGRAIYAMWNPSTYFAA